MVETNDEWITSRTGVKERRILKGEGLGLSDMCAPAVNELLKKTKTLPNEVDLVICATTTPDMVFPATANIISDKAGIKNAWSFDLNAACSGFVYALASGAQFIETGKYKKVIVIGGDKMSSIVDYQDRSTCILFGDGAGAVVIGRSTSDEVGLLGSEIHSDGTGAKDLWLEVPSCMCPGLIKPEHLGAEAQYPQMNGQRVFKKAVRKMPEVAISLLKQHGFTMDDVSLLIPHQANMRINEFVLKF